MNVIGLLEKHPVFSFICAFIVLTYIWGLDWTIVLLITFYLIEQAFKDTEEEEIYGKQIVFDESKLKPIFKPVVVEREVKRNMFTNHKKKNPEKRPSLQELVSLKRDKTNVTPNSRQPLAAIIKNNMNIKFTNAELEKRKPLYTSLCTRSPHSVPSPNTSRNIASPLTNRTQFNNSPSAIIKRNFNNSPSLNATNLNSSLVLNRSALNASPSLNASVNNSISSPLNDSLEVHGSYFINRSVLHSPAAEPVPTSPSVPFLKSLNREAATSISKSSTESVVEALKQKSKRKRVPADATDESANTKKKKTEDIDMTLMELLPNSTKRKNISDKEVSSIATQCTFDEDDLNVIKKKKKIKTEKVSKFGLSQNQIDELSNETAIDSLGKVDDTLSLTESEGEGTVKSILSETSKKTSQDSPFNKSVSFADTPDMKKKQNEVIASKTSSKLSALRNMESPYKRLFKDGPLKNITPESVKKMRKHPVYFTAKINIDEIQQHQEEYGESGVSLKAFRLDKEEAAKRIDSLFDETDGDVDFKLKSITVTSNTITVTSTATISLPSLSTASTLLTTADVKTNLFGTSSAAAITTASATVTSTFSFGGLSSLASNTTAASSTASLLSSSSTLPSLPSLLSSVASTATSLTTTTTISFGTVSTSSLSSSAGSGFSLTPAAISTQAAAPSLPTLSAGGFSFGGGSTAPSVSVSSAPPPSFSFSSVSQTTTLPTLPTLGIPAATSLAAAPVVSQPAFNISFKPPTTTAAAAPSATAAAPQPLASGGFNFGSTSISAPASAASGFSFAPSATAAPSVAPTPAPTAAPAASVPSSNIFGGASLSGFGAPAASSAVPSLFGGSAVKTVAAAAAPASFQAPSFTIGAASAPAATQASIFGGFTQPKTTAPALTTSLPTTNIFASSQPTMNTGFSFGSTAAPASAPSTGFSFAATTTAASAPAPAGGFSFSTTTAASTGFSFGSTTSTNGNIFNISTAPAATAPPANNIFGQASTAKTQPSGGIFGAPAPATATTNIFGGAATASKNIFGAPAPASSAPASTGSIFGAAPTQSAFGSSAPSNGFGTASTQNIFGGAAATAPQPQASIFGDQAKPTGFNFGAQASTAAPAAGSFSFGATTTAATGSVFGQSSTGSVFGSAPAAQTSVFGAAAAPKPSENPFDFSASLGTAPKINFGAAPVAQAPKEIPKPSFNFGAAPATPTFGGTPASPAFGSIQQPAFGSPQPFGTPTMNPAAAGGGFTIGSGTSNPPPTRQTQRARRRLRR